jgi:hypothetical protein
MLRLASLSFVLVLLLATAVAAPKTDYFTEDELDLIRDAQELQFRVPAYFKLAERRLIALGLMGRSANDKERERKEQEKYEKEKKKAGGKGPAPKPPVDELGYLQDFTKTELLRGYAQALDEVMTNIDDAYSRKLEVRGALEQLEKFTRETMPILERFQPNTDSERSALSGAIDKAKEANTGAKDNLKIIPKTEKKPVK